MRDHPPTPEGEDEYAPFETQGIGHSTNRYQRTRSPEGAQRIPGTDQLATSPHDTSLRATGLGPPRRELLRRASIIAIASTLGVPMNALAQNASALNLAPIPAATRKAIEAFTQSKPIRTAQPSDAFKIDVAELAENGHTVPVGLSIAASARAFALFTEANPQPDVAIFRLPAQDAAATKTQMSTRIRLAMTQRFWCIAQLASGEFVAQSANVVVTLAACIEE
jgi:sulfur-oxidizing protein SoxY